VPEGGRRKPWLEQEDAADDLPSELEANRTLFTGRARLPNRGGDSMAVERLDACLEQFSICLKQFIVVHIIDLYTINVHMSIVYRLYVTI
jgi:hypothetical protein